ncbi:acyl transferase domain-containing protein [Rheinheimera pacifica]|uniref:malonyl CoA-ACP transacylase n=1 Tax=Rheinheimera pacifica TaxID=173990 RepID=UPI00285EEFFF|nr:malonyl CoA-ACP transacylase [Rheinheimera pacifica]MDR6983017.1 acyl transferase domain-containing protein [Rheinheimera pacifica]
MKKTALVVCPGRGTYNKAELGYISNNFSDKALQAQFDAVRAAAGLATVSELDRQAVFSRSIHLKADNAAALIFAAGVCDYYSINRNNFDVVAVTGNSMGWYTALGCAGVLTPASGMQLVTDMAQLTADGAGAQFIYPVINDNWQPDTNRIALVQQQLAMHAGELFMSIVYGGYAVIAGSEPAVKAAMAALPPCDERFPMLLAGHAAFHTSFMQAASDKALSLWPAARFNQPQLPLIDGRGQIWPNFGSDLAALQRYTLQHQVCQPYHFSKALQVAVKEFAPQHIILLGPGASLGGAVAQSLIEINWQGLSSKQDFIAAQQSEHPYMLSMGIAEQRLLLG